MGQASSSSPLGADDSAASSASSPCSCFFYQGCVPRPFVGAGQQRSRDIFLEVERPSPSSSTSNEATAVETSNESDLITEKLGGSVEPRVQAKKHVQGMQGDHHKPPKELLTMQTLSFPSKPPDELLDQLVAVDCGMVRIGPRLRKSGKKRNQQQQQPAALRRVCIVDGRGVPLLNEVVRVPPPSPVVETHPQGYQTRLGRQLSDHVLPRINPCGDDLNVGLPPDEVKRAAADLVKGKIVIGHSVDSDLRSLELLKSHPRKMVRDTALYPPFLTKKGNSHRLSFLVKERLGRNIQQEARYHGCMEDAVASLDLYLSDWEKWEKMTACSPLMHTHTSKCNLTNTSALGVASDSVIPGGSATMLPCQEMVPAGDSGKKEISRKSSTLDASTSQHPSKKELRKQRRMGKKQRKRERREGKAASKKSHSYVVQALLIPVDILSSIFYLPGHIISYTSAVVSDVIRLVAQGPTLAWRYVIVKLGYQAVPEAFPNQRNRKMRNQLHLSRQRARGRKRFVCLLLWSFRDYVLLSHIVFEPLAIVARYQRQVVGISTLNGLGGNMCNHWGITMIAASMSLLSASVRNRYSRQSRISLCILAYYHILFLYNAYERKEWGFCLVARWREGRGCPGIPVFSYSYLYLIYHMVFFLYSPAGMFSRRLWRATKYR